MSTDLFGHRNRAEIIAYAYSSVTKNHLFIARPCAESVLLQFTLLALFLPLLLQLLDMAVVVLDVLSVGRNVALA